MELFSKRSEGHLEIFNDRIGFILRIEGVLVRIFDRVFRAVINFSKRRREIGTLQFRERIRDQHCLHEPLCHADVEERPFLFLLPHLDQALSFVEGHIREGTNRDVKRWIFRALGRLDDDIRQADQLFLDHGGFLCLGCHDVLFMFARSGGLARLGRLPV